MTGPPPSAAPRAPIRFGWRPLQYGVLWGLATTGMEAMVVPVSEIAADPLSFAAALLPMWCCVGVLIAHAAVVLERHATGTGVVAVGVLIAVAMVTGMTGWTLLLFPERAPYHFRKQLEPLTIFCYNLWSLLFYGSLMLISCLLATRAARARQSILDAEVERNLGDAMLAEIRLDELKGRIDPMLMREALAELRHRYAVGSPGAQRLFDALVAFLRQAMPGLRHGDSTLCAEIETALAYVQLRASLDPGRVAWRIEAAPEVRAMPFPPLRLVSQLQRRLDETPPHVGGVVRITRGPGGMQLEWHADAPHTSFMKPAPHDALSPSPHACEQRAETLFPPHERRLR